MKLVEALPFPIREIPTENVTEWTTQLFIKYPNTKILFEQALADMDIIYHRIRIATPRHNGKVERQHRLGKKCFTVKCECTALKTEENSLLNLTISQKAALNFAVQMAFCLIILWRCEALQNAKSEEQSNKDLAFFYLLRKYHSLRTSVPLQINLIFMQKNIDKL